ncbi:FAD-dependent monooxygenase [Terrabacter sp. MAHUQ-38]|uniref:FAD-dependent monooxygenase n=1 Tax=unclassified Terrabacter TaxID=2630222 RepID=UPI00165E0EEF|nr:FAD-dependent monooxygenase [Terrabacter sp. MAHUQ-38]MBC9822998.1 FAD-dependent monooxygenase [Terrabacter sp. MAHUQ-38]
MDANRTTTHTTTDCDVLVVGAGPTGLTLATQLLARGVSTRIIDRDAGSSRLSRAIGIQARTMEVLDLMGILDRFLEVGHRVRGVQLHRGDRDLVGIDMAHNASPYGFMLHLPQHRTEALLRQRLTELGGEVEHGVELVSFSDEGDHVSVTLRDSSGRRHTVRTAYVAGCDGAHSTVRHLLGAPFVGHPHPFEWLLADTHVEWDGRPDLVHVFARTEGPPLLCVPITADLWRLSLPMPGTRGSNPPTLEEIQSLVDQRSPRRMLVRDPETLTSFRCQLRSTAAYRTGRVLLAGDAVHIHSPAGGQGMNTGMQDATNLAWKLALVATRRAPDRLLESYGLERGPVAAQVLAFTEGFVRFGTAPRSVRRSVRDALLPALRLPAAQRRLAGRMAQTSVAYPAGPLTRPGRVRGLPRPGERMPDLEVESAQGPTTLYAALRAGRHVLVDGTSTAQSTSASGTGEVGDVVDVVTAPLPHRAVALVRPDGYVAAVGTTLGSKEVREYLHTVVEPLPARERQHERV